MTRGSPPHYSLTEIIVALTYLHERKKEGKGIGRYELARRLQLTTASTRTLLRELQKQEIISSTRRPGRKGSQLTEKGEEIIEKLKEQLYPLTIEGVKEELKITNEHYALLVRNPKSITLGIRQRDVALFAGGSGAITLIYKNRQLIFPDNYPTQLTIIPKNWQERREGSEKQESIEEELKVIKDGDIVIIGLGKERSSARMAAYAAAIDLLTEAAVQEIEQSLGLSPRFRVIRKPKVMLSGTY